MERQQAPDLVESVLDLAGLSEQIMAHMARWGGQSAPDAPPPNQVFRDLVGGILHPLVEHYSPPAVEAASEFLAEALTTIEAEILLVEPPRGGPERRRRPRLPRRAC
jgi:hypothetical protein